MVSPDIANAPYRHHVACCHPTVRTPARHTATSSDREPADSHAQLAEKALIAPKLEDWLQPQRSQAPAARRQWSLLWRSQSGVLRGAGVAHAQGEGGGVAARGIHPQCGSVGGPGRGR